MIVRLEPRTLLSVTLDSETPTQVPIGKVVHGDTVQVQVTFSTNDPNDQNEGEPLILKPSDGPAITISTYGTQIVPIRVTQDGETLSAYIVGADGDESATVGALNTNSNTGELPTTVAINGISTNDSKSLIIDYTVANNPNNKSIHINVYRSSTSVYSTNSPGAASSVASIDLVFADDVTNGAHEIVVNPKGPYGASGDTSNPNVAYGIFDVLNPFRPDPTHKYMIAVGSDPNTPATPPQREIQILSVAIVANDYSTDLPEAQSQNTNYATALKSHGEYDDAFAFNWASNVPWNSTNSNSGSSQAKDLIAWLDQQIAKAGLLSGLGPDDVIDVNFIGYGRGAVLVGQSLSDLATKQSQFGAVQLQHGYYSETLIDPHPISIKHGETSTGSLLRIRDYLIHGILSGVIDVLKGETPKSTPLAEAWSTIVAEAGAAVLSASSGILDAYLNDPNVVVPGNVQAAVDLYQQTPANEFLVNPVNVKNLFALVKSAQYGFNGVVEALKNDLAGPGKQFFLNDWGESPDQIDHSSGLTPLVYTDRVLTGVLVGHYEMMSQAYSSIINNGGTLNALGITPFADPLEVTTEPPATVTAGKPFEVDVKVENSDGTTNTSFNGSISISAYDGQTVYGTTSVQAVNGVAKFTNLSVRTATQGLQLDISTSTLPDVLTNQFNVVAATATQLAFANYNYIPDALTNGKFNVTVDALDQYGNLATTFGGNVSLAIGSNAGNGTLGGALKVAASQGVVTFTGVSINRAGDDYTLAASGSGMNAATSESFNINDQLVITSQPPATITAGAPFSVTVKAEDVDGRVDPLFTGRVTVYDDNGSATVNAVAGVATFSGLTVTRATGTDSTESVYADSDGLDEVASKPFSVVAAAASMLVPQDPTTSDYSQILTNGKFNLMVSVEDKYGNIATTYNGNVSLKIGANPGGGTLGGTATVAASRGQASFSGITISKLGSGYTLAASATGLTTGDTDAFDVKDQLVVTKQPPATITAGTGFSAAVTAEDANGKVDGAFNGAITVSDWDGYSLGGTTTVNAKNGVAGFANLKLQNVVSDDELYFTGVNSESVNSNSFNVVASSTASQLSVYSSPHGSVMNAGKFSATIDVEDQFGNVDTSFNGNVVVALKSNPGKATLSGKLTVAAISGVATFSNLALNAVGTGFTLTATSGSLTAATTPAFDVIDQLVVTTQPPVKVTTGTPFSVAVTAEDANGKADASFSGAIVASDEDGNPLGSGQSVTVTASKGVATFIGLTLDTAQTYDTLYFSGSQFGNYLSATSNSFQVSGVPSQIVIDGPDGVGVGNAVSSPFSLDVYAEDKYGNIVSSFNGQITLSLDNNPGNATLGGTLTLAAIDGKAVFSNLTIDRLGNAYTLKASGKGLPSGVSAPFDIVEEVAITTPPPSNLVAGAPFDLVATAEKGVGNVDTSFNGYVTIALSDFGGGNAALDGQLTVQAINGVAKFTGLRAEQEGQFAVVVTNNELLGSSVVFGVAPASFTYLEVTRQVLSQITANAPFSTSVAVTDAYGNVDTDFNGKVTLSLIANPGAATLGGTLTAVATDGIATFSGLTVNKPGSGYTLAASSSGFTSATTRLFNVSAAGVATHLVFTSSPPSSYNAGQSFTCIVKAEDDLGKVDSTFSGTVELADGFGNSLGGTISVKAVKGVAQFAGLRLYSAVSADDLLASSGSFIASSSTFNVIGSSATKLHVVSPTGNLLSGAPFTLAVDAVDPLGNVDQTFNGNVTIALGSNPNGSRLGGTLTVQAVAGVATFGGLTLSAAGTGYTIVARGTGLTAGTSGAFNVSKDQYAITTQPPNSIQTGLPFGFTVSVKSGSGAVDASFNGSVTVSLIDFDRTGATLGGKVTTTAKNGVVGFSGISIGAPGDYALLITGGSVGGATTVVFTVAPAPEGLQFSAEPPGNVTVGAKSTVAVSVMDASGDVDQSFVGNITLALGSNPGKSSLGGTHTVPVVNGVATFTGLTLNQIGAGYTLVATASGQKSTTSDSFNVTAVGAATRLVVTGEPPATFSAGAAFKMIVSAEDSLGNVDKTFNGVVTISDDQDNGLAGTLTVKAVDGIATFADLTEKYAIADDTVTAASGALSATTEPFSVKSLSATQLSVVGPPSNALTSSPFLMFVDAEDPYGNIDPTFDGLVTIALAANSTGASLGGTLSVRAIGGVAEFDGPTISKPGTGYVINASSSNLPKAPSTPFDVTKDQLVVTTQVSATATAGTGFGLVVSAETSSGAVDTAFNGNVTLSLINYGANNVVMQGTLTVAAVKGIAKFSGVSIGQPGSYAIQATGSSIGGVVSDSFVLLNGAAAPPTLTVPSATTANENHSVSFTGTNSITISDTAGSQVSVTLSVSDGKLSVASVSGITVSGNGSSTLKATGTLSGINKLLTGLSYSPNVGFAGTDSLVVSVIDASKTLVNASSVEITVVPAAAAKLVITSSSISSGTAGKALQGTLTVAIENQIGTIDTSNSSTITLALAGGTSTTKYTATAVKGIATFAISNLRITSAGTYSWTASDGTLSTATSGLTISPAAASKIVFTTVPSTGTAGAKLTSMVAKIEDAYGNIVTVNSSTVTLSIKTGPGSFASGSTPTAKAVAGVATFSNLILDKAGTYTVNATDGTLTSAVTGNVTVSPASASKLVFTKLPTTGAHNSVLSALTVVVEDAFGNLVKGNASSVKLVVDTSNPTGGSFVSGSTTTVVAVGGVATFTNLELSKAGTYTLKATDGTLVVAVSGKITIS